MLEPRVTAGSGGVSGFFFITGWSDLCILLPARLAGAISPAIKPAICRQYKGLPPSSDPIVISYFP